MIINYLNLLKSSPSSSNPPICEETEGARVMEGADGAKVMDGAGVIEGADNGAGVMEGTGEGPAPTELLTTKNMAIHANMARTHHTRLDLLFLLGIYI